MCKPLPFSPHERLGQHTGQTDTFADARPPLILRLKTPLKSLALELPIAWYGLFVIASILPTGCHIISDSDAPQPQATGSWPMPRHDTRLSGRATVPGQIATPQIISQYPLGTVKCSRIWPKDLDGDKQPELLAATAGGLLAVTQQGNTKWHVQTNNTPVVAVTDLDDDGTNEIVLRGPEIRSTATGQLLWRPTEALARHEWRIHVGRFLQGYKRQQIVALTMRGYDVSAHVYTFEQGATKGQVLWERKFQTSDFGDYAVGMVADIDQDGNLELCVSVQGGLVALDLRSGEEKLRLQWEEDGEMQRNYGQITARDIDGDGRVEVVLVNTLVALQVAVVKIGDNGNGSLLWNRYWGHWYPNTPYLLHTALHSVADLDGDGDVEITLSVYEHGKGWTLQVYDARDGRILAERKGLYLEAVITGKPSKKALILCSEQNMGEPARFSTVHGLVFSDGQLQRQWHRENAHIEGQYFDRHELNFGSGAAKVMDHRAPALGDWNNDGILEFVLSEDRDQDGQTDRLTAINPRPTGQWQESMAWSVDPNADVSVLCVLKSADDATPRLWVAGARGQAWSLDARNAATSHFFAGGPFLPAPAVADINGDGKNEIVVGSSDGYINALKFTGKTKAPYRLLWRQPGWGAFGLYSSDGMTPVLADLDGDGRYEVLIGTYQRDKGAGLACLNGDGSTRWQWFWPAPVPGPEYRSLKTWVVGRFSNQAGLDIYLSTRANSQTDGGRIQQSWTLHGSTGTVMWHSNADSIRAAGISPSEYWLQTLGPSNLPSIWDLNGDGKDDILMMCEALFVQLDGNNGKALSKPIYPMTHFGEGTPWTADASVAVQDLNADKDPELLLTASWGAWGALTLAGDPLWSIDPGDGIECTLHGGIGDIDGDGLLELGMPHPQGFRCYDGATGQLKWEMNDLIGSSDVITADIDGDAKDEFIFAAAGNRLVAINGQPSEGAVLWSQDLGMRAGSPIVADVNGDGFGEILVGTADGVLNIISTQKK